MITAETFSIRVRTFRKDTGSVMPWCKTEHFKIISHFEYNNNSQTQYCMDFCLLLLCWQMTWMTLPSAGKSSRRACAHQFLTESSSTAGIWSEAQKQVHLRAVQTKSEGGCNDSVKVLIWAVYALVPCGAAWLKLFLKKKSQVLHSVLLTYFHFSVWTVDIPVFLQRKLLPTWKEISVCHLIEMLIRGHSGKSLWKHLQRTG